MAIDFDALRDRDGDLTDEEAEALQAELVRATREFHQLMRGIQAQVENQDPELARKMKRSADSMLENVEKAASLPFPYDAPPGSAAD